MWDIFPGGDEYCSWGEAMHKALLDELSDSGSGCEIGCIVVVRNGATHNIRIEVSTKYADGYIFKMEPAIRTYLLLKLTDSY